MFIKIALFIKSSHISMNLILRNLVRFAKMQNPQTIKTKFIAYKDGGADNMFVDERDIQVGQNQLLMKIKAVGINRAETLHRMGKYPINKEVEKYLGLEASGEVIDPTTKEVLFNGIALLSGGSYAQYATIPKTHVMKLPQNLSFVQKGGAIPEAWLTAFQLLGLAELQQNQNVVIYAGASGVGTAAIQICKILKVNAFAVVSSEQKRKLCMEVGAKGCVLYKGNEKWDQELIQVNNGKRFDAVLDCVGVSNLDRTINLLDIDGRWILYGLLSGPKAEVNFAKLMQKRIVLKTSLLKARSEEYKNNLIKNFSQKVLPEFQTLKVKPIIDSILKTNWSDANPFIEAHKKMQKNENAGKIIIQFQ